MMARGMDPTWWGKVRKNRDAVGTQPGVSIVWLNVPPDPTLKERAERAIHNGARAARARGRVDLDSQQVEVIHVFLEDIEIPGPDFPVTADKGTAARWLDVAGIATA